MSNLAVVALARAIKDVATAKAVAASWKLSNDEVKQLVWTVQERDFNRSVSFFKHEIVYGVNREWIYDLLRVDDRYDDLRELQAWETPKFPVSGNDLLITGRFNPGPELGKTLTYLKNKWIASDFHLTKGELLSYL